MTEGPPDPAPGDTGDATPPDAPGPAEASGPAAGSGPAGPREPRSLIERIGLAAVAFGLAVMFGGVGYAAWLGGEVFLAVIGAISSVMTVWVGLLTLLRS